MMYRSKSPRMNDDKAQAYTELAAELMELHASVAQNVEKMARTDEEISAMAQIFNRVFQNAAQQSTLRDKPSTSA
ncbi:hypothetical protein PsorP6_010368 [Peronosclerospora sorghi]|uniref:Uncharacterized protein n=1 Tax=Peronosclerospora sorghi TaxID=230839 RepID=A0ACC0VXP8_9STRA|nr:hypothetical protein PsorP6_010368 [Peronosclerospora sorghi]